MSELVSIETALLIGTREHLAEIDQKLARYGRFISENLALGNRSGVAADDMREYIKWAEVRSRVQSELHTIEARMSA